MLATTHDVAELLSLEPSQIDELVARRLMPQPLRIGGQSRFDLDQIHRWVAIGCPPISAAECVSASPRSLGAEALVPASPARP